LDLHDISEAQAEALLHRSEGHFLDNKAREIRPSKLTKSLSASANADGGELIISFAESGNGEFWGAASKEAEDANGHIQH